MELPVTIQEIDLALVSRIKVNEEFRAKPYRCTKGKLTIGFGTNIEDGITMLEAEVLLYLRISARTIELKNNLLFWDNLSENRKNVLIEMAYNLGITKFLKFENMIAALEEEDWNKAAYEMLDSVWAGEVKGRAVELSNYMRIG